MRVLLVIMRLTYGWNKEWDRIPISQLMKKTGLCRQSVCVAVSSLIEKGMIKKHKIGASGTEQVFYSLCVEEKEVDNEILEEKQDNSNISDQSTKETPPSLLSRHSKETNITLSKEINKERRMRTKGDVSIFEDEYLKLESEFGKERTEKALDSMDYMAKTKSKKFREYGVSALHLVLRKWIIEDEEKKKKEKKPSISTAKKTIPAKIDFSNTDTAEESKKLIDAITEKFPELKNCVEVKQECAIFKTKKGEFLVEFDRYFKSKLLANARSWYSSIGAELRNFILGQ
jgi:phage replication O-like protein O